MFYNLLRGIEMENETTNSAETRQKRKYSPRQPKAPEVNSNIAKLESDLIPLMTARREVNSRMNLAAHKANLANQELQAVRGEFEQIDGEINYTLQVIGQLKNGGMPVPQGSYIAQAPAGYPQQQYQPPSPPYTPAIPYPQFPTAAEGVSSLPAPNRGLYPDATDRFEGADDVRSSEMTHRGR
jgi:hypothetical protein